MRWRWQADAVQDLDRLAGAVPCRARAQEAADLGAALPARPARPGERKSLQPMAARLGLSGHDQLQHFIASPAWDDGPLWRVLAEQADRLVGGPEAVLVIDDTALPKKGTLSVGVARQYCGAAGQAGELPGAGLADAGRSGGAGAGGAAAVPARGVDRRSGALRGGRRAGDGGGGPHQGRDRAGRAGPADRRRACGSASCWPTPAMARAPRSATAWTSAGCPGRSASRATRRSTARTSGWSRPRGRKRAPGAGPGAAARPRRCWPSCPGAG